jgi:hypothetical protein
LGTPYNLYNVKFLVCPLLGPPALPAANILLARDGSCKLADVGLAKVADDYLTAVNTMGTFAYW